MLSLLVVAVDAFDQVDAGGEHRWFITVVSLVAGTGWPPSSRHLVPRSTSHPGYALRPGIYLLFVPFRVYRHPVKAAYASVSPVDVLSRDRYAFSARCPVPDCSTAVSLAGGGSAQVVRPREWEDPWYFDDHVLRFFSLRCLFSFILFLGRGAILP